ncbi:lytic transglycosylase domain-containing protein [Nocardia africana]
MQFLPSTWAVWGTDGDGDGIAHPNNVFDAALSAGRYLCAGGANLHDPDQQLHAVLRYNNSMSYASDVLRWSASYGGGGVVPLPAENPATIPLPVACQGPVRINRCLPRRNPHRKSINKISHSPRRHPSPGQPAQQPQMIVIPGLPPIPCGILCPPSSGGQH